MFNLDALRNPYLMAVRKNLKEVLKEKYAPHDPIVERIMTSVNTKQDAEELFKFINVIFQEGYTSCLEQYKEELNRRGIKVDIKKSN